jgi:hypothetical protein
MNGQGEPAPGQREKTLEVQAGFRTQQKRAKPNGKNRIREEGHELAK